MILALYVDGAILIGNDVDGLLKRFKSKLVEEFSMIDLGHIQYYLGIYIKREIESHHLDALNKVR